MCRLSSTIRWPTYDKMMVAFEFSSTFFAFVSKNFRVYGVTMSAQNVRRFKRLRAQIAMKITFLKVRIPMVDHVTLRTETFTTHIAHIFSYVFVAPYVRCQILFIFETFLAHGALGRTIIGVVLHMIIEISLFAECLRTMWAPDGTRSDNKIVVNSIAIGASDI